MKTPAFETVIVRIRWYMPSTFFSLCTRIVTVRLENIIHFRVVMNSNILIKKKHSTICVRVNRLGIIFCTCTF